MYSLFNYMSKGRLSVLTPPGHNYIKDGYLRNLHDIREKCHQMRGWVKNDNLIVSLLSGMSLPMSIPYERYYDNCRYSVDAQVIKHRLCSPISVGEIRQANTNFYNAGISEIYISVDEPINIELAIKEWDRLEPIRVITHPFSDLSMAKLDGNYPYGSPSDVAVFLINIPVLALMYRRWYEEVATKSKDVKLSIHSFVENYVIPSITPSHLDIARFNRLYNLHSNSPSGAFKQTYPFYVTDYTQRVDEDLKFILDRMKRTPMSYYELTMNIPAITRDNFYDVVRIPRMLYNRQVTLALFLTRLRLVHFLLSVNTENNISLNRDLIEEMRIEMRQLENDKMFVMGLPVTTVYLYQSVKSLLGM